MFARYAICAIGTWAFAFIALVTPCRAAPSAAAAEPASSVAIAGDPLVQPARVAQAQRPQEAWRAPLPAPVLSGLVLLGSILAIRTLRRHRHHR